MLARCTCCAHPVQVHRALYRGRHPVAVKMLTDPDLRSADPETLRSFKVGGWMQGLTVQQRAV
jgi:hypothetical protein